MKLTSILPLLTLCAALQPKEQITDSRSLSTSSINRVSLTWLVPKQVQAQLLELLAQAKMADSDSTSAKDISQAIKKAGLQAQELASCPYLPKGAMSFILETLIQALSGILPSPYPP